MIVVYVVGAIATVIYAVHARRASHLDHQPPGVKHDTGDPLLNAVLDLTDEVRGLRVVVAGERRARRWLGVVLLAVILVGGKDEIDKREQRDRDCQASNEARSNIRIAFSKLADELAPVGTPGRPKADAFLLEIGDLIPPKDC